jgi:hypothetical protein
VSQIPETRSTNAGTETLPLQEVESLLSTLAKTLRAYQMYESNNPVFQRFRASLGEEFTRIWSKLDSLDISIREDGFGYGDQVFAVGQGRESLAFAFYKDGIRFLKFLPGFEREIPAFLEAVRRAGKRSDDADDMIAVLWEEDFESLQYGYVDLLMEGVSVPDAGLMDLPPLGDAPLALDQGAGSEAGSTDDWAPDRSRTGSLAAGLTREDFDETLYFLDPGELSKLQTEVTLEMERDLRGDVLNALFDRLEEPERPDRQAEIMGILDQLMPLFLSRGYMANAGQVLEELDALRAEGSALDKALAERIDQFFLRLGDPEVLEQFVQALEDGAVAPGSDEVTLFFSRLHAGALPVLIRFAEMSDTPGVRGRLASAIDGLSARYPAEVESLLGSAEATLVKGAARSAGRVGLGQAVRALRAALSQGDREVRLAVVEALVSIRLTPALQALTVALADTDRDVRIAAAKALGTVRFASARDALAEAIEDRRLKDADLTEKMTFFEAYGAVGGSEAVDRLAKILNGKGFFGRRASGELRACAALGLGKVASPAALQALERGRRDEDPVVRNAVLRALKQEAGS